MTKLNDREDVLPLMARAVELARNAKANGNVGVAALIVKDGRIIGEGVNREADTGDPLMHAEMEALRDVFHRFDRSKTVGAMCVTTVEPCPMCAGALILAGVSEVVAGARHTDIHPGKFGLYEFERLVQMMNTPVRFSAGTLKEECAAIRRP